MKAVFYSLFFALLSVSSGAQSIPLSLANETLHPDIDKGGLFKGPKTTGWHYIGNVVNNTRYAYRNVTVEIRFLDNNNVVYGTYKAVVLPRIEANTTQHFELKIPNKPDASKTFDTKITFATRE